MEITFRTTQEFFYVRVCMWANYTQKHKNLNINFAPQSLPILQWVVHRL